MKFTVLSLALGLAGFAAAQSLEDVPECAAPCIADYTSGNEIADCGQFDIGCICSNSQFLDGIACCLDENCDEEGKSAAVTFAQQICGSMGVEVPDEVTCGGNNEVSEEDEGDVASSLRVGLAGAAVAMAFAL